MKTNWKYLNEIKRRRKIFEPAPRTIDLVELFEKQRIPYSIAEGFSMLSQDDTGNKLYEFKIINELSWEDLKQFE